MPLSSLRFEEKTGREGDRTMQRAGRQHTLTFASVWGSSQSASSLTFSFQQVPVASCVFYLWSTKILIEKLQSGLLKRAYGTKLVRSLPDSEVLPPVRVIGVTLVRCGLHQPPNVRANLKFLGLKKMHQTVYQPNIASIRGILYKVRLTLTVYC